MHVCLPSKVLKDQSQRVWLSLWLALQILCHLILQPTQKVGSIPSFYSDLQGNRVNQGSPGRQTMELSTGCQAAVTNYEAVITPHLISLINLWPP